MDPVPPHTHGPVGHETGALCHCFSHLETLTPLGGLLHDALMLCWVLRLDDPFNIMPESQNQKKVEDGKTGSTPM